MDFDVAAGSVAGRTHALAQRACQDAFVIRSRGDRMVAVVTDGCGSSEGSEVGAWLGAHVVCSVVERLIQGEGLSGGADLWERARRDCVESLAKIASEMGGDREEVVRRFLLFTVVGFACDGARAAVFAAGDGLVAYNGEVVTLGPFVGNAPPYLGHALLGGPENGFEVVREGPARDLESAMIATDGAVEMIDRARSRLPGANEVVGGVESLWTEDRYFDHPDALRRRLARMNRPVSKPLWEERRMVREGGLLEDDTTIVVLRRKRIAKVA